MAKPAAAGGTGAAPDKKGKKKTFKKKERKHVPHGVAFIQASFNNTIVWASSFSIQPITWCVSIRWQPGNAAISGSDQGLPMLRVLAPNHP
jgi:small subunit ribosomal protein S11